MKNIIIVLSLLVLPIMVFATPLFEDFEDPPYVVGYDPDNNADWDRDDEGGYFEVVDLSGNQAIKSNFIPDPTYIGYCCDGADLILDVSVDCDFRYDGSEGAAILATRIQSDTNDTYVATVYTVSPTFNSIVAIRYMQDGTTEPIDLSVTAGPVLDPLTWHNLKFIAIGTNPVLLIVCINDEEILRHEDNVYNLDDGWVGVSCAYDGATEPEYWFDNFNVEESPSSIESGSLGEIKATFK